jgi:pimeloyl-ACP methyl ester carboxylesterase
LVLVLLPVFAAGAANAPSAPSGRAFYNAPAKLISGKPGTVIWSRRVHTPAEMSAAASTTLVLYRSVLPNGNPTAVSGLVFIPRGKPPKGGWRLISWAHGTTGIADQCAPSRNAASSYIYPDLNGWLKRGYAIAQTDYQGLGTPGVHLYLIGRAEGASVVDIALAARRLDPRIGVRFAIAGHSQGGQAALFAAAEARADAPALKLVGVAAFAPASHITPQVQAAGSLTAPGGALSALGGLILTSAAAASPAVHLSALLTPAALALVPEVQRECLTQLAEPSSWGGLAPAQIERPGADPTALYHVLDAMNPALKIVAPVLILQGEADTTVFPAFTGMLDQELIATGDHVELRTFPDVTHATVVTVGYGAATAWLAKRFR